MNPLKQVRLRWALFLVNLLLLGYLGFLLLNLYRSHDRLHGAAIDQLQQTTVKRALALELFLNERTEELVDLSEKQMLLAYFENLYLGMSLEYGLGASLNDLRNSLERYRLRKKLGDKPLYQRVMFIDVNHTVLVDTYADDAPVVDQAALGRYLKTVSVEVRQFVEHREQSGVAPQLVLAYPYRFKDRLAGHLLVWISLRELCAWFVCGDGLEDESRKSISLLHDHTAYLCRPTSIDSAGPMFRDLPPPSSLEQGRQTLTLHDAGNRPVMAMAASIPISGTPLTLTAFTPLNPSQEASPLRLVLTTGAIGLLILTGTVVLIRTDLNSRLFETRLAEARLREEAVAEKNRILTATAAELKESKEQLSLALEGADLGLWNWHIPSGRVDINQQWATMLGYQPSEVTPGIAGWESLVHPDDIPHVRQVLQLHLAGESPLYETEHRCRTRAGTWLWLLDRGRVVERDAGGHPVRMAGTHLDINDRKLAEERLQKLNEELEQRIEDEVVKSRQKDAFLLQQDKMASIGQLAAGVAHEINNPMGFIISNLRTLREYTQGLTGYIEAFELLNGSLPDLEQQRMAGLRKQFDIAFITTDVASLLSESLEGADRVKQIVLDLKDFARVDETDARPTDLNQCVRSTVNIVRNELKYVAQLDLYLEDVPMVFCVPQQINQVITNLLVNAAQAIEGHGSITVTTHQEGEQVVLTVADTGKGMPDDVRKRIFEPFFTTKPVGQGTGLGLTISYDMVKKNGGDISVESEPGQGTSFTVRLPVQNPGEVVR